MFMEIDYSDLVKRWDEDIKSLINTEGVEQTCLWLGYGILRQFERIKNATEEFINWLHTTKEETKDLKYFEKIPDFYIKQLNKAKDKLIKNTYITKAMMEVSDKYCKSCFTFSHMGLLDRILEIFREYSVERIFHLKPLWNELKQLADTLHSSSPSVFTCPRKED